MSEKVSFTVRRPTPISRASSTHSDASFKTPALPSHKLAQLNDSLPGSPLYQSTTSSPYPEPESDKSDSDDNETQDELVDAFDKLNGAQRTSKPKKVSKGPLVIPALKNKDWRELARKRRTAGQFVPPSAAAQTGADGSVGGLGTKDSINSGPVLQGLQRRTKVSVDSDAHEVKIEEDVEMKVVKDEEESEDQKALRAILAGDASGISGPVVDIIPTSVSEEDAYKQDVDILPEPASLQDYDRVPVSQFGAAMLRGMGWKEGQAASRKPGKGIVEPYLPEARPALLGIGAKQQEVYDDGSKNKKPKRQDRRYVPVVKTAREGSERRERSVSPRRDSGRESTRSSRRNSADRGIDERRSGTSSRSKRDDDRDKRREYASDKDRDRNRRREDRERDTYRDRGREKDRDGDSRRRDRSDDRGSGSK